MNSIKRIAGILWMAIGPVAIYYLLKTAIAEIAKKPLVETKVQWAVFAIIFIPIAMGLVIFGYYAVKGEYDERMPDAR